MDKQVFVRACREGGAAVERALRELDRTLFVVLLNESLRAVPDRDLAEDLVQETLIKVWRRCASFRAESELLPWIRSILRHTILDALRRREHEITLEPEAFESALDNAALTDGQGAAPDQAARQAEIEAAFQRGWQRFQASAPAHAAVLAWVVDDGLTPAQVAVLLGRSPGATREFISQCRKRARLCLTEWHTLARGDDAP